MKRNALLKEIKQAAKDQGVRFEVERQGSAHELWRCGSVLVAIPRHSEIGPKTAFEIKATLEPALGKRWWR